MTKRGAHPVPDQLRPDHGARPYYQAEVAGIPGIDKTDQGYRRVQHQVLKLRRDGRLDYDAIADATRWMRKPRSYDSVEHALAETARTYRKSPAKRRL